MQAITSATGPEFSTLEPATCSSTPTIRLHYAFQTSSSHILHQRASAKPLITHTTRYNGGHSHYTFRSDLALSPSWSSLTRPLHRQHHLNRRRPPHHQEEIKSHPRLRHLASRPFPTLPPRRLLRWSDHTSPLRPRRSRFRLALLLHTGDR